MNIIFLFYEYLSEGVGGLSHIWHVSKNLQRKGHKIIIFAPRCDTHVVNKSLNIKYVPTINIRFFRFLSFHFLSLFFVAYHIVRYNVDIIYVREMALSLTPLFLSKIFNKPMITEVNGDLITEYEFAGYPRLFLAAMYLVQMIVCRESQTLICVTEGLRDIFQNRYTIPSDRIEVVPNGTDTSCFYPLDSHECRRRLGIDPKTKIIGFVGTFVPHQGLSYLVESSRFVLENHPEAIFLLVGDGPMRKDILNMVRSMGLVEHFIFPGAVPQEEVVFYINAMDVCVAPFTRSRNERIGLSPLKIYDYMACGKPVVASDIKGVGDLLRQNDLGIAVRPEDPPSLAKAILLALDDQELAVRCLQTGPPTIKKNFTWQITAQRVVEVCSDALRQKKNN